MLLPPPFPIAGEQLSIEILSQALGADVASFSSVRIGADRGMLGEIFLVDLTYGAATTEDPDRRPTQVVAKFAALREGSLASARRAGAHERELRCFTELLADTPVRAPHAYAAWYDPETAHFLLIQDAIEVDPSVDQIKGLSIEHAKLVLEQIAKLHARWWESEQLADAAWLPRLSGEGRRNNLATLATNGWDPLCQLLGDELSPAEQALGAEYPARLDDTLCQLAELPSTLIHNDLRADNLLFNVDGERVHLVDWQGCSFGPPSFDLAYFLSQSLTVSMRRSHEDELLEFYREHLAASGVDIDIEQVRAGYAESFMYPLAIACALPIISDPNEPRVHALTLATARRSIEAMRDHGQLWDTAT